MPTFRDQVEDACVERLSPLALEGFVVRPMPDTGKELSRPSEKGRVTIAFARSYNGDSNSPGRPAMKTMGLAGQEQFVEFSCFIESPRLRGTSGVYYALEKCTTLLIGWQPLHGWTEISFMDEKFEDHNNGVFSFNLTFLTARYIVPAVTPDNNVGGLTPGDYPDTPPLFSEGCTNL